MEFKLGPEIISSYKRLSYSPWYALAEFIDNSTQAYFNNREALDKVLGSHRLKIEINYGSDDDGEFIIIKDNSIGMSKEELENAVIVGRIPPFHSGRSKYGVGMKTAACWFGNYWSIKTKKLNLDNEEYICVEVDKIAAGNFDLNHESSPAEKNDHYTIIEIRNLNRKIRGRTFRKIRDFLRSMYRRDFNNYNLQLIFQGIELSWDYNEIENRLIKRIDGSKYKREFEFKVNEKLVKGWAGVLEKGSRSDAGFTILQSDRVIIGYPDSYRPVTIFGDQEGGSNDLVNQRLVGEIELDGFDVSHTKDEILFEDDEKEELEALLLEELADLKVKALAYRKYDADERSPRDETNIALNEFEQEIISDEFNDLVLNYEIPAIDLLKKTNIAVLENVTKRDEPLLKAHISDTTVYIYISDQMSPYDPYVIIDSTRTKESIYVLINKNHPHWTQLKNKDGVLNFIRHCVYDAVAEWKTYFKIGKIDPDTVKNFKDRLLRIPFEIERHAF